MNIISFLDSLINYEKVPGYHYDLAAYLKFLEKLGSPQRKLRRIVHIAGTKGKGSTAAMIGSCLAACGYRVGLYTSPHLVRVNERIRINDSEISDRELERYLKMIRPFVDHKTRIGARTFFEVLTAAAFMHFARHQVDVAVLEAGLGGRLDATNAVSGAVIPVITRIGYDHMNMLGRTLARIAREKAGIIKKTDGIAARPSVARNDRKNKTVARNDDLFCHCEGSRFKWSRNKKAGDEAISSVITIRQRSSIENVIKRIARRRKHMIVCAGDLHRIKILREDIHGSMVRIKGKLGLFNARLPLAGAHQVENLSLALAVLDRLRGQGLKIGAPAIEKGIARVKLRGRFEVISKKPLVIYDVAHNEDSFRALEYNISLLKGLKKTSHLMGEGKDEGATKNLYLIFGCSADKDISYAVKHIFPRAREVLLVKAGHPRAMEPLEIIGRAKKFQKNIIIAGTMGKMLEYFRAKAFKDAAIIVFGSFYLYPKDLKNR